MEVKDTGSVVALLNAYRLSVGFGVPVAILVIGIIGKKVARGPGWDKEDFCAGSELTLAGVSGALVNLFEFLKPERVVFGLLEKKLLGGNIGIAIIGLLGYWFTLSLKQDYGPMSGKSLTVQRVMMLGVSNAIGLGTLFGALLLMAS